MSENERLLEAISEGLDGIWIPLWIVDACDGDMNAARMLARLMFWFGKGRDGQIRARLVHKGHRWVAKRHDDWWDEARLGEHQAKRAALKLVSLGLADVDHFIFSGMRTAHYRLLADGIARAVSADLHRPRVGAKSPPAVGADSDVAVSADLAPPLTDNTSSDTTHNPLPSGSGEGIPVDDTTTDTDATSASALIDLDPSDSALDLVDDPDEDALGGEDHGDYPAVEAAAAEMAHSKTPPEPLAPDPLDRTAHWAGGSPEFNELADQLARWMGKSTAGLHAATAKAIKSGAGRLLAREVTGELVKTVYGKRWFREHWAGGDRSKTLVARSPRGMRQIEDWIAMCDETPPPADHALIDAALAPALVYPTQAEELPQGEAREDEAPEVHPWLANAISMSGVKPGSVWGQILGQARLIGVEAGVAVVELSDERAVGNMTPRAHALQWPPESGATSTRFVAAGLATQVAA